MAESSDFRAGRYVVINLKKYEKKETLEGIVLRNSRKNWLVLITKGPHQWKYAELRPSQLEEKIEKREEGIYSKFNCKLSEKENDFLESYSLIPEKDIAKILKLLDNKSITKITENEILGITEEEILIQWNSKNHSVPFFIIRILCK